MKSTLELPRDARAPASARRAVAAAAAALGPALVDDACLLVSELVTNSVRHGKGARVTVRIETEPPATLRCEVADDGDRFAQAAVEDEALGGWGLRLVDALADDWGVASGSARVWFELSRGTRRRDAPAVSGAAAG
jgi:anti-sigma regulatory factor (Ser/Thr protein kinase)